MISLSTAWSPKGLPDLASVLAAGRKIGFRSFELGVSHVPFDLRAVLRGIERDGIAISSVHAVCCPYEVPASNARGDWIGEADEERRSSGVAMAKETADAARRVGAAAVVLHGGILPVPGGRETQYELCRLVAQGAAPADLARMMADFNDRRAQVVAPHLDALVRSVKELCEYAPDVLFGLETRYYMAEIPQGDEFAVVFDRVGAPNLRYWHDVGHAHVLDRIGFMRHVEVLDQHAGRLAGMHLHDISGFEDHRPPGTGDFNFGAVAEYLRPGVLRVMEVAPDHPPKAVRQGREHLAEMYGIE